MRFTDRVASLHPAAVTITFVLLFIGSIPATSAQPFGSKGWAVVYAITMALTMLPIVTWHYSIYRAASDRSLSFVGHRGRRAFLFALCLIGLAIFLITFPIRYATDPREGNYQTLATINSIAMMIGCLSYFVAIWAAANALTRFDERKKAAEIHKTLGTFLLELYFPIGIWFIYPRIKRTLAAPILA